MVPQAPVHWWVAAPSVLRDVQGYMQRGGGRRDAPAQQRRLEGCPFENAGCAACLVWAGPRQQLLHTPAGQCAQHDSPFLALALA